MAPQVHDGVHAQEGQPRIDADVAAVLTLRGSLAARKVAGGTAPEQVLAQIERHRARLSAS